MDNAEARTRVLQLYKAWYRHIPTMVNEFDIPVNVAKSRDLLRDKFRSNAHIKDTRVIDMLVVKVNIWLSLIWGGGKLSYVKIYQ